MAHFVKNDTNFYGAKSKSRVDNRSSKKKDVAPKNYETDDDGWGSVPKSSSGASNCDDGWGHIPQDSSTSDNAWGQDRLVHGKAERNRRFRSNNSNSTFRVPCQSRPNWSEDYEEFPALGSRTAPQANVWEKRKEKFEEMKAIEPTNETEEERMIQKAIELSKMEINHEEERRRQLEEEYRLQTQLLEANPEMFEEFRLGEETYKAVADKFVAESYGVSNGYSEEYPNDETGSIDHLGGWDSDGEKTIEKKDLNKEQKSYESPKDEDSISQLKQDSWSQPPANTAGRKSSYSGARPKISKVVDMFGGWGTAKPAETASYQDNVGDVPDQRSTKWDTVDVEFASRSSSRKPITVKPTNKLSSPDSPEVKIENTYSNWDTAESEIATKLSNWDSAEVETANKLSSWETNDTETASKLSNWDTVKTIDANLRNTSSTVTPEKEICKVPSVESHQQADITKVISKDQNWSSDSVEAENSSRTSDNFELNSESNKHRYVSCQKDKKLVLHSEQKISESKADFETQSKGKFEEIISDLGNGQTLGMNKHEYPLDISEQYQGSSPKTSARHAEIKAKINSLEGKCFDSHVSVESDYAFLLSSIDPNYKGSTAQSEIPNQKSKFQTEDLHSRNTSSFSETEHQLKIPQLANQTTLPFGLPEDDACKDPPIPGPHPLYTNYMEAPSLTTFDEFPGQVDNFELPLSRNGGSRIDPPKAAVPTPELINPVFPPQPMMAPIMNPALMGMNPMLVQQMMMLSNPFFVQQLQQMDMYYKSLGMTLNGGMSIYPQPMPLLSFANNPNPQVFSNMMGNCGPSSAAESGMIPPPFATPAASSPPGINASHLLTENPSEVDQPDDDFWFKNFLPSDSSSLIPPPKPTPVSSPENLPGVSPEPKINPTAFSGLSLGATSMSNEGLSSVTKGISPIPGHQPYESSNRSPEVPYAASGWGDIEVDSKSKEDSGWCDDTDGWGSENSSTTRSMRNPSRHTTEKKTACRQPASRSNPRHY